MLNSGKIKMSKNILKKLKSEQGKGIPKTKEEYLQSMRERGLESRSTLWINDPVIRVFKDPRVKYKVIGPVLKGIQGKIDEIGLNFKAVYSGENIGLMGSFQYAFSRSFDPNRFFRDNSFNYAYALILGVDDHAMWGAGSFDRGGILLYLSGGRQNCDDAIIRSSKHEASHLLGLEQHHDKFKLEGYSNKPFCNSQGTFPVIETCDKCKEGLVDFWRGIEESTGRKFFLQEHTRDSIIRKLKSESR